MSETSQGPGWWLASDGRWYSPEAQPDWSRLSEGTSSPGISPQGFSVGETGGPDDTAPATAGAKPEEPPRGHPGQLGAGRRRPHGGTAGGRLPGPRSRRCPLRSRGAAPALRSAGRSFPGRPHPQAASRRPLARRPTVGVGGTVQPGAPPGGCRLHHGPGQARPHAGAGRRLLRPAGDRGAGRARPAARSAGHARRARRGAGSAHLSAAQWAIIVVAGVLTMFVSVVSHATIIARVMARFHGQQVSNTGAARAALTKSPQLMAWAFINYVVVSILRSMATAGSSGCWSERCCGRAGCWPASSWCRSSSSRTRAPWPPSNGPSAVPGPVGREHRGERGPRGRRGRGDTPRRGGVDRGRDGLRPPGGGRRRHRAGGHPVGADRGLGGVQRRPLLVCGDRPVAGPVLDR